MLDWLIVGGGLHGTYLSNLLLRKAGVPHDKLRVLDPHEGPLELFWRFTRATGMRYLRSPAVHHLDLDPYGLRRFAERGTGRRLARFVPPYGRPGLDFFRAHTEHVVRTHRLAGLRLRARAEKVVRVESGYRVESSIGGIESRRVLLAIGLGEQPCRPPWASEAPHIFDPAFERDALVGAAHVLVVGGGISAAQLACFLARARTPVTVVSRHEPRVHLFDSDPEWLGPKAMAGFERTRDLAVRRRRIVEARHRGSMPPEVAAELSRARRAGWVEWVNAGVKSSRAEGSVVALELDRSPGIVTGSCLVLATGFESHRPGGRLVDEDTLDRLSLCCADCGYPIVSRGLEWAPGLFVSGPLAELALGPVARNIAGASAAGDRLLSAAS